MNFQKIFQYLHWKTKPTRLLSLLWLRNHCFKIQTTTATIKKASNQEASMILLGPGPPGATYRFYQLHSYSVSCLLTSIKLVTGMSDIAATIKSTQLLILLASRKSWERSPVFILHQSPKYHRIVSDWSYINHPELGLWNI